MLQGEKRPWEKNNFGLLSLILKMVPTNSKVFLCGLLNMLEKQIKYINCLSQQYLKKL